MTFLAHADTSSGLGALMIGVAIGVVLWPICKALATPAVRANFARAAEVARHLI
jgi:hypothetical protein